MARLYCLFGGKKYNHLANLCGKWDEIVDVCNGKNGSHAPENAAERQTQMLYTLDWFTKRRMLHDAHMKKGDADEYIVFADETWLCILALILAHVGAIQIYCTGKNFSINPRSVNTDNVELSFRDA